MPGIMPDAANGGLQFRDAGGVCTNPANVQNAYCPPSTFITTCPLTALPNDCTARITPAQINAIVSELMCLAVAMDPDGPWNCNSVCNLSTAFQAWSASSAMADGVTIGGTGTAADPFRVIYAGLISTDANNPLTTGGDGKLTINPALVASSICANDSAADTLAACLISTSPGNQLVAGPDGRMFGGAPERYTDNATAPASPNIGDRWRNAGAVTSNGVPPGVTATWNGTSWDSVASAPEGFTAQNTAPVAPVVGDRWHNTNTAIVAGVSPNARATWNGTVWEQERFGVNIIQANAPTPLTNNVWTPLVNAGSNGTNTTTDGAALGTSTLTIGKAGFYMVRASAHYGGTVGATTQISASVRVLVNGAVRVQTIDSSNVSAGAGITRAVTAFEGMNLAVGDVLTYQILHQGDGTMTADQNMSQMVVEYRG